MKKNKNILVFLLLSIILTSCNNTTPNKSKDISNKNQPAYEIEKNKFFFLNSILTLNILDDNIDKAKISDEIEKRIIDLENKFSTHLDKSEVIDINNNSGIKPIKVSDDTFYVIKKSLDYSNISNGLFDVTVGNLVNLWGIDTENEKLPKKQEINDTLPTIDYKKIQLDEINKTVFLKQTGMKIDLGAIAKGYVADEINKILEKHNVKTAIINLGGNIYVYGNKNGDDFKVGIRNPSSSNPNEYLGIYKTQDNTIVTSGVYERFFEQNGIRYHHILSTKDGYPINNHLLSTSIITKYSIDADALSTTTFALGLEEGLKLIESMPNVEAIFITDDKKIYLTSGAKEKFTLTNKDFTLYE